MQDIGIGIKENRKAMPKVRRSLGERRTAISQKRVLKRRAYSTTTPGKIQAMISRQTQMVCCRIAPEVSGGPSTNRGMREQSPGKQETTTMYIPQTERSWKENKDNFYPQRKTSMKQKTNSNTIKQRYQKTKICSSSFPRNCSWRARHRSQHSGVLVELNLYGQVD